MTGLRHEIHYPYSLSILADRRDVACCLDIVRSAGIFGRCFGSDDLRHVRMKMRVIIEFEFPDDKMRYPRERKVFHAQVLTVIQKHQFAISGELKYLATDRVGMSDTKIWQNFNG